MNMTWPEVESHQDPDHGVSSLTPSFSDNEDFVNHSTLHVSFGIYYFQLIFHSYLRKNLKNFQNVTPLYIKKYGLQIPYNSFEILLQCQDYSAK